MGRRRGSREKEGKEERRWEGEEKGKKEEKRKGRRVAYEEVRYSCVGTETLEGETHR